MDSFWKSSYGVAVTFYFFLIMLTYSTIPKPRYTLRGGKALVFTLLFNWMGQLCSAQALRPTEEREWHSTAGTTLLAVATQMKPTVVQFKTPDDRLIAVPLNKLVPEDQSFLIKHFGFEGIAPEPGKPIRSQVAKINDGLEHPIGKVEGPVDAGEGSHYFVYIPTTLREGRNAPLLLFTGAGGGNASSVKNHMKGAEINGWIVAASVESKNSRASGAVESNHQHAKRCVEHLIQKLPVDPDRVYFTGNSGGGAMAFHNCAHIKSAGAMPIISHFTLDKANKSGHYFIISGATDYNRYGSAFAADKISENAIQRFHTGGHSSGPNLLVHEGMTWLNGRYLANQSGQSDERLDYEESVINWILELKTSAPHRAHYWCYFLQKDYRISGHNGQVVAEIFTELETVPVNRKYTEGIIAIDTFSKKYYGPHGKYSIQNHTTPKIKEEAEKLAVRFQGVPVIEEIAERLGLPTQ